MWDIGSFMRRALWRCVVAPTLVAVDETNRIDLRSFCNLTCTDMNAIALATIRYRYPRMCHRSVHGLSFIVSMLALKHTIAIDTKIHAKETT